MKKLLALVLALVMTMSLVTISNAAFKDADTIDNKEAVEVMNAIGVLVGDAKGNFKADAHLTRAQAAKIICVMLLGKDAADGLNLKSTFSDASGWAESYIAYCASQGIVAGVGDGKFDPNGKLTGYQFAKMLLVALGYKADVEGMTGTDWQVNVAKLALNADLAKGLEISLSKVLTRDEAAQMAFNTLKADMVEYKGGVNVSTSDGTSVVVDSTRSKVGGSASVNYNNATAGDRVMQFCEQYFPKLKSAVVTARDDYGRPAVEWKYNSSSVGIYATVKPVATWTTGIEDITEGDLYKELGFSANGTLDVYENGTANSTTAVKKGDSTKNLAAYKGATLEAYDVNDDGKADTLIVCFPYLAQVTKVTAATKTADRKVNLKVWDKGDNSTTSITGYETEAFEKDQYVLVYAKGKIDTNATKLAEIIEVKAAEVVKGKADSVKLASGKNSAVVLDGTKYTVGGADLATMGLAAGKVVNDSSFSYGDAYTLYTSNGYILGAEGKNTAKDISDIVYVVKTPYAISGEYGTETVKRVQVIHMDGTVEVLKLSGADSTVSTTGFYKITKDDSKYKFAAVVATTTTALDNSTNYYGTNAIDGAVDMKADTKTVKIDQVASSGPSKAYVTNDTRTIYVKNDGADLKTSIVMGAVKQSVADNSLVLLSKDSDGNYVVEALVITGTEKVTASDDTVYVNNTKTGANKNGDEYEMYNIKTGEKTTVTVSGAAPTAGFATYSIDKNGVYKFNTYSPVTTKNTDGAHELTNALTKRGTLLSLTANGLEDIEAKDAVIINNTGNSDNDSLSLSDIAKAGTLAAVAYVDNEVVTCIVVNNYAA